MVDKAKILAGRKEVDAYREAHRQLYSKPWHRGIPEEHTPLLNIMVNALKGLGFNSIQEFFDANRELNKQVVDAMFRIDGECDGCPDREKGCEPHCFEERKEFSPIAGRDCLLRKNWQHISFETTVHFIHKHGLPKPDGSLIPTCKFRWVKIQEPDIDWEWH